MLHTLWLSSLALSAMQGPEITPAPKTLRASRSPTPIVIDGRGDEVVWQNAEKGRDFAERRPNLNEAPPVETTIQVAYTDTDLYVLVQGVLSGESARIRSLRRDSFDIFSDDTVSVKIDPFFDRRSAFTFAANLAGSQFDAMGLQDGRVFVNRWDAVWEVEATQENGRFTLEYRIPFYALGVRRGDAIQMGLNCSRDDPNRSAVYDWRLFVPPRSPLSASAFGTLVGLENIDARPVLELSPYVLGRSDFSPRFRIDPRRNPNVAAGVDLRLQTGPGAFVEGSVLTDFAQVDLDEVQVASDRFPLYYPEQRPFFIRGLNVFNFGHDGSAQLFFSRRIGLDGEVSPIASGLKAYGRGAKLSYGLLNVQTLRSFSDPEKPKEATKAAQNFSVGRLIVQPRPHIALGVLGLARLDFSKQTPYLLSFGVDSDLRSRDQRFRNYSFFAGEWRHEPPKQPPTPPPPQSESRNAAQSGSLSEELAEPTQSEDGSSRRDHRALLQQAPPSPHRQGISASTRFDYEGLYFRPSLLWLWSSKDFSAPMGFYRRPGRSRQRLILEFVPRPSVLDLREIAIGVEGGLYSRFDYKAEFIPTAQAWTTARWRTNWSAGYEFDYARDEVAKDFQLYGGLPVLTGRYHNLTHRVFVNSPGQATLSGGLSYKVGRKFGGPNHRFRAKVALRAGRHFTLTGSYTQLWGHLARKEDRFNFGYANGQGIVAINRDLVWDTLFRVNMTPKRERFGLQSRIRWRYRPGSDLFLVYANDIPLQKARKAGDPDRHTLTLKLNFYTAWRLPKLRSRQAQPNN